MIRVFMNLLLTAVASLSTKQFKMKDSTSFRHIRCHVYSHL